MALDLRDMSFAGAALPEPFVKFELEDVLTKWKLLRRPSAAEARALDDAWEQYRRKLRNLGEAGGEVRVAHHVLDPLKAALGYATFTRDDVVRTREGDEDGGWVYRTPDGASVLRAWSVDLGVDVDAPSRRGRAYRFSPARIAERVLLAKGERVGVLTDGVELRVILCDPARTGSHLAVRLDKAGGWRGAKRVPDSYRLVQCLCAPAGVARVADLVDLARLSQTRVTKTLREQAQTAVLGFVQSLVDDPRNTAALAPLRGDPTTLAATFWREALVVVYRLLFILRLESSGDPARAFTFASTSLWRNTYSPHTALAPLVRMRIDRGVETGNMLGDGLRALFRLFEQGLTASELRVVPLGGMLFGEGTTPTLDALAWGEDAVAHLLDRLLWTPRSGKAERQRVHYGALEVEDLGRVYEALLEKEPGLSTEPMCRLRRQKLEVVVPAAQGARYRTTRPDGAAAQPDGDTDADDEPDEDDADAPTAKKATVVWVEDIPAGRFYLRTGLGRKATGSYYTPDAFVRFLVEKTLGPQVQARSPVNEPDPGAILTLKVLDPAMGSGHFLVGACRYLADKLYEACRLCDEKAAQHRHNAENTRDDEARREHDDNAREYLARVEALPDPNDELLAYLPSRVRDGEGSALAQAKAQALCRRLVAVHCLYGVDKNPLAVELAKLALWLESYAEGLPLTFMDHRLVAGDSLTGPFLEHLGTAPGRGEKMADDLYEKVAATLLQARFVTALKEVAALEATVGKDVAEVVAKRDAKRRLDRALEPLRVLARVWSGGVMLGGEACDDAGYAQLVAVAAHEDADAIPAMEAVVAGNERLQRMRAAGADGVAYELVFPEVFWPKGYTGARQGFDAVLGNPPWDALQPLAKEFFAAYDLRVLDAPTRRERAEVEARVSKDPDVARAYAQYGAGFERTKRLFDRVYHHIGRSADGAPSGAVTDLWQPFAERGVLMLRDRGHVGVVVPSAFHANQSATGIRALYLEESALRCCFSFENLRKLFEIDSRFKFALVVASKGGGTADEIACGFYLQDPEWLFRGEEPLVFDRAFVRATGGAYLSFMELRSKADAGVAATMYRGARWIGAVRNELGIRPSEELHMSKSAHLFTPTGDVLQVGDPRDPEVATLLQGRGYLPLHEGKTFHQYTDQWEDRPRYLVTLAALADKSSWRSAAQHYRLVFRCIASSTNERTSIFALLPPGILAGHSVSPERDPEHRRCSDALLLLATANTFSFDWVLRQKNSANVSLFIIDGCSLPTTAFEAPRDSFLAHGALRLTCNHAGYAALWREQLGDAWREPDRARHDWPAVAGDDARWQVRAAIDAVVADAYGLTRAQYEHVLRGFSHKSYPAAPARCLTAYDALKATGLAAFVRANEPYWDIPLVETLPKPVIELGGVARGGNAEAKGTQTTLAGVDVGDAGVAKGKRGKKKGGWNGS